MKSHDLVPLATVGALIIGPQNQVLLIRTHKWGGRWGIPGGKVQYGEEMMVALKREISEETGLEIRDIRFALVQEAVNSPEFYRPAHFVLVNYIARTNSTQVRLNEEAEEYRWVTPEEGLSMNLNTYTRTLINEYLNG